MGRTARTFRDAIEIEEERWSQFKRTLRPPRRGLMDRIFEYSRKCADAGTMIVTPRTTEVILMSAIIEMLGEIDDLQSKVAELEETIKEKEMHEDARMASRCQH